MWINSLKVTGECYLEYNFGATNILLGENGTGKSTFVKLLLYILGVDIPDFIDEITKYRLCDWACAEIQQSQRINLKLCVNYHMQI